MKTKNQRNMLAAGLMASGCLLATTGFGFITPPITPGIELKTSTTNSQTYRSSVMSFTGDRTIKEYDTVSNALRYLSGSKVLDVQVSSKTPEAFEAASLSAIRANPTVFGVDENSVRINKKATLVSGQHASVSFHVYRNGLRIKDAGIVFHFNNGSLILVKSETYSEAETVLPTELQTGIIAASAVGGSLSLNRGSSYRVKATDSGYSLVKVDEFLVSSGSEAYVVQVDTSNGSVFELRNKNFHLNGSASAKVYPRYFGDSVTQTHLPFVSLVHSSAETNAGGEFVSIDSATAPVLKGFGGKYIIVKNEAGDELEATAKKVGNKWDLHVDIAPASGDIWENGEMAQAMVYLNTTKIVNEAKKYIDPDWFDAPLVANVNHSDHCNAYWDGETMNFFSGGTVQDMTCANTGIISDVTFHEWGHGLDDNTGGIDDSGLSEGYGDALSAYMTDDPKIGIDFLPLTHKPVRDISVRKVYPADVSSDPHKTGLIVAGAWYNLNLALKEKHGEAEARKIMGKFLFKGIYQYAKMADVYKATVALDDNNGDLSDGTPNLCLINKAFINHGLAKADPLCP
jgi:hypothetical protein